MIKVTVKVPATTANIGPGFDCMGLALSLWSEFVFEPAGKLVIEGCPQNMPMRIISFGKP